MKAPRVLAWLRATFAAMGAAVLALSLAGCGGRPEPLPTDGSDHLVRFQECGFGLGWSLEVDTSGECRAEATLGGPGRPIGHFRTSLSPAFMERLRQAVGDAAHATRGRRYPIHTYDALCRIYLPDCRGFLPECYGLREIEFEGLVGGVPKAIRPLYNVRSGLLVEALALARKHPTNAVTVSVLPTTRTPHAGGEVTCELRVRSVGSEPVGFPSVRTEQLVSGSVTADLRDGGLLPVSSATYTFGPPFHTGAPDVLTPQARADLPNMLVLAPGEAYRLPGPQGLVVPEAGVYQLRGLLRLEGRYAESAFREALGAPVADGLIVTADVELEVLDR
ncbi:MAG: hypothetical protein FJX75_24810 [Armatimonadetes bacterium]|nr:hypothetical protein [Armatimonadota bacterium]